MGSVRQPTHERFPVAEEADAGALRRLVTQRTERVPATPLGRARAELVATELATNLLHHAKPGGFVLVRTVAPAGIELLAVDHGPGIADLPAAVEGRTPAPKGLGCGLAAIRRASSTFDIHTEPGHGTTVLSIIDLTDDPPPPAQRAWAGVSTGVAPVCGDGWAVVEWAGGLAVAVVDGLGHGPHASAAADAALAAFAVDPADLDGFVRRANGDMRATRGGAVAVCRLDPEHDELHHLAIGNVSGRVFTGVGGRGLGFMSGTLGLAPTPPRARIARGPWPAGATLVLWTDGLSSRVGVSPGSGLLARDPAVIAATLHRDHARGHDDATVVVIRRPEKPAGRCG